MGLIKAGTKPKEAVYSEKIIVRVTKNISNQIKAKALEQGVTESEIVRVAINNYIVSNMTDSEIVYASLSDAKRHMKALEKKIEILGLVLSQSVKQQLKFMPDKNLRSDFSVKNDYFDFLTACKKELKDEPRGFLEQMVLDVYESGGAD